MVFRRMTGSTWTVGVSKLPFFGWVVRAAKPLHVLSRPFEEAGQGDLLLDSTRGCAARANDRMGMTWFVPILRRRRVVDLCRAVWFSALRRGHRSGVEPGR